MNYAPTEWRWTHAISQLTPEVGAPEFSEVREVLPLPPGLDLDRLNRAVQVVLDWEMYGDLAADLAIHLATRFYYSMLVS